MNRKLFLTLFLSMFSTSVWSEDIFDNINRKMGVSRIEYSIHRIEPKLTSNITTSLYESYRKDDVFEEKKDCTGSLPFIPVGKYKSDTQRRILFICNVKLKLIEKDYKAEKIIEIIKSINLGYEADFIATRMFYFFGHTGGKFEDKGLSYKYPNKSLYVLATYFNDTTKMFEPTYNDLGLAEELSRNFFFRVDLSIDLGELGKRDAIYLYPFKQDFEEISLDSDRFQREKIR